MAALYMLYMDEPLWKVIDFVHNDQQRSSLYKPFLISGRLHVNFNIFTVKMFSVLSDCHLVCPPCTDVQTCPLTVADPGFPRGGRANIFAKFS